MVAAEQGVLAHDRDPEERVERQGQDHEEHPGRVADPSRHRVDADDRPEEQRADHDQVQVHQLVQPHVGQGGVVPGGEVEGPRRHDVQRQRERRERQHLRDPRVEHGEQPAPGRVRKGAERERDRRAERQGQRDQHREHHVLDHVHAQQRGVVRRQAGRRGDVERAHPDPHEHHRAAHRPGVAAPAQGPHAEQVETGRPDGHHEGHGSELPPRQETACVEGRHSRILFVARE